MRWSDCFTTPPSLQTSLHAQRHKWSLQIIIWPQVTAKLAYIKIKDRFNSHALFPFRFFSNFHQSLAITSASKSYEHLGLRSTIWHREASVSTSVHQVPHKILYVLLVEFTCIPGHSLWHVDNAQKITGASTVTVWPQVAYHFNIKPYGRIAGYRNFFSLQWDVTTILHPHLHYRLFFTHSDKDHWRIQGGGEHLGPRPPRQKWPCLLPPPKKTESLFFVLEAVVTQKAPSYPSGRHGWRS